MRFWIILFCFIIYSFPIFSQKIGPWKLKKDKNDLRVYVRDNPSSPIKELKMKFSVEASMQAIVVLLQDVAAIPEWVYKCPEANSLKKVNKSIEYYYTLADFPWPLDDRDMIVKNVMIQDSITKVVRSESYNEPKFIPKKKGIIRIPKLHLWWEFTPRGKGIVDVEYFLSSDPGGMIPAWIINMAIDQGPLQTIKAFRKALKKPKYRNARLDFISELGE